VASRVAYSSRPTYVIIPSTENFAHKVEKWEETYIAKMKPSNQDLLRYHAKVYLLPKWGKTAVEFITAEAVNEWLVAPELGHLAPTTVKGIVTTLQLALGKRFGKRAICYPSKGDVEDEPRCYPAEEVQTIVEAAEGQYKTQYKLAVESGARAGELYALTVGDLLFEHNVVRINKSMYRQKVGSPKTKNATRWVNVKPYVMEMLKQHLNGRTEGLVFRSKRVTPLVNCVVLYKHLHPLLRKLGLERGGMHGFRHHRVSTLVMAATPMAVIKKWIGHGSEEMVNLYTHLRPDFMQDELARVPDFAGEFGSKTAVIDPFDPKLKAVA
jgi:integrase